MTLVIFPLIFTADNESSLKHPHLFLYQITLVVLASDPMMKSFHIAAPSVLFLILFVQIQVVQVTSQSIPHCATFNSTSGLCLTCNVGYFATSSGTSCAFCPAGTYGFAGVTACLLCRPGTYGPVEASGSAGNCLGCPAQTFSAAGSSSANDCETCPVGTFSPAASAYCAPCAEMVQGCATCTSTNTGGCTSCQAGYALKSGSCVLCNAGKYSP